MIDSGAREESRRNEGRSLKSCRPAVTERERWRRREAEAEETGRPPETKLTKDRGNTAEPGLRDHSMERVWRGGRIRRG